MKNLIEKSKYLNLIAVLALLVSFVVALGWGVMQAFKAWKEVVTSVGQSSEISLYLIKTIDAFLISIVLYLLAVSIYKLFIGDLNIPPQMVAKNLAELKSKLSSLIVLVLVVSFVEEIFENNPPINEVIGYAVSISLICGVLVAFSYVNGKHSHDEDDAAH